MLMKRYSIILLCFAFAMSCQRNYKDLKSPYQLLHPKTTSVTIIKELNDFNKSAENHIILSHLYKTNLNLTSAVLKNINTTKPVYVASLNTNTSDYVVLTKNDSSIFNIEAIPNHITERLKDQDIKKVQMDSVVFYTKIYGDYFTVSNNLELLKSLNAENENTAISHLIETSDHKSIASFVTHKNSELISKLLFDKNYLIKGTDALLDINYTDNSVSYHGVIKSTDSSFISLDGFANTIPQTVNAIKIAPADTKSMVSITYNDYSNFTKNISKINKINVDTTHTFLDFSNEMALSDNTFILHALDTDLLLERLDTKTFIETYRAIDIFEFGDPDFFENRTAPFFSFNKGRYFFAYKQFVVFSDAIENLKPVISAALNNNTLANSEAYRNISKNLTDEASVLIFKNSEALSLLYNKTIEGYDANALQLVYDTNYTHVNGVIQKFKKKAKTNVITEAFSTELDATILSTPQSIKNHVTGANDIIVQDVNNVLYLISNSGNILWKKQLNGKVLGQIEQIDMFKNGRFQLAFATANRLYILDRNGNNISRFPLKFNDKITQPLSVFDYDKKRNYRLLITQGKALLMYDIKGKLINGFNYKEASTITAQPKHFRIRTKDYITFSAGKTLKILNRQGKDRIVVKDNILFSGNEIYKYKNTFTTTNTSGKLVQVNTKGYITKTDLNLPENHNLVTTSKTLVTLSENKLKIKSKTIDLDYGDYTPARIFYLNDKIYVTTTDLQAKKVYLFDSQAKPIPNFPVFGTTAAELQNLDKEQGLELITQADDKTIIVYKLN